MIETIDEIKWQEERKRFVFSFIDRQIKKSLLNSKDSSTSFEACQVGGCYAEPVSTADSIVAYSVDLSTTDEILIILNKINRELAE